jgi:O-antigen/teichoic acid export membrane protein
VVEPSQSYEQTLSTDAGAGNLRTVADRASRFERLAGTESVRANLKRKSIHGAFFTAAGAAADFVVRLAATATLARLVIPEYWGLVGMVTAITAIAEQFRDLGLSAATVQKKELSHQQVTNLFWVNVLAGLLITLAIGALAPVISAFYGDPRLTLVTVAMASNFFWGGLTVQHHALMVRQMKLARTATLSVVANTLSAILAVVLALNHYGYWALVWREMARSILLATGTWALCPWVPGLPRKGADIGGLLRFGRDISVTTLVNALVANLDQLLIGKLAGAVPLALYRQGYQLIMAPVDYLFTPIRSVAQPGLSAVQADPGRYRRYFDKIVFFVSSATMPLALFVAIYAREITLVVLGVKWAGAAPILTAFALTAAIRPTLGTSGMALVTSGRSKTYLLVVLMHSATLVLCMLVAVRWGAEGIALAHFVKALLLTVPTLYYSFRGSPISISHFFATVSRPVGASLAMSLALLLLRATLPHDAAFPSLAWGGAASSSSYLCAWLLLPGGKGELKDLLLDLAGVLRRRRHSRKGSRSRQALQTR